MPITFENEETSSYTRLRELSLTPGQLSGSPWRIGCGGSLLLSESSRG